MRRRDLLGALGLGGVGLLSGCSVGRQSPTGPDDEPSPTTGDGTATPGGTDTPGPVAEAALGELVEGETLSLVVRATRREQSMGPYTTPGSGKEFLVVRLAAENTTDDEFVPFSPLLGARVTDDGGDGYEQAASVGTEHPLTGGHLAPGEVTRGDLVFEVPTTAGGLALEFDFGTTDVVTFDGVVVDLTADANSPAALTQDLAVPVSGVGDAVSSAGATVTLNGFSTSDDIGFATPDEGNQFAVVDVSVTNDTGEATSVSTAAQMIAKDGRGFAYPVDVEAQGGLDGAFAEDSPISDGATRRGSVAYEVPTDASPLYWTFEFGVFSGGEKSFWQLR